MESLMRFLKDEDAVSSVEYAVMLALILVVCIVAISALGTNANSTFSIASEAAAVGKSGS